MSGGSPATTTQVSKTELPAWVDAAGKANYDKAVALDDAPINQYQGNRVAPLSGTTTNAFDYYKTNQNAGMADTNAAGSIFSNMAGGNVDAFMNPYIDNVETKALDALDRSRLMSINGNNDNAVSSKAFGGSRQALTDAVTNSETAREAGILSAGLRSDGFNTAYANANSTAAGLAGVGTQKQDMLNSVFSGLTQIGSTEQQQDQSVINADIAKFDEGKNKELNDLNTRLSALGMTPYSSSNTSTTTGVSEKQGTDWGSLGVGLLSVFAGLSEDDEKTDKQKVGTLPGTDLDLWAYRYKKDPKTYPKVVGVMASDVQKKHPEAVTTVNNKRIINYTALDKVFNGQSV